MRSTRLRGSVLFSCAQVVTINYDSLPLVDRAKSQEADGSIFRHSVCFDTGRLGARSDEHLLVREKEATCLFASNAAELHSGASVCPAGGARV